MLGYCKLSAGWAPKRLESRTEDVAIELSPTHLQCYSKVMGSSLALSHAMEDVCHFTLTSEAALMKWKHTTFCTEYQLKTMQSAVNVLSLEFLGA